MNSEAKKRIKQLMNHKIPEGYKKYKDIIFPSDWSLSNLGDIVEYKKGFAFKSKEYCKKGIRIIRISDTTYNSIKDESPVYIPEDSEFNNSEYQLIEGDLTVSSVGSRPPLYESMVGKVIKVPKEVDGSLLNQNAIRLRGKNGYCQDYIYYHLKTSRYLDHIEASVRGNANQVSITLDDLFKFVICIPTEAEQKCISKILSTWDKAIELKERLIDEKKKQKTGLMQKLLTGKVRLPSFIGEWKEVKLGKVIREINDKTTENNQYQVLTSSRQGIFLQEEYFNKSVASSNNIGYKIIKKGQFTYRTMSDDGSFKFNRLMEYEEGIVSPAYVVFETTKINPVFLMNLMNDYSFNKHIQKETQGGTRLSLKYNSLKEFVIKIPSIEEQDAIANVLNIVDKVIELNQKELEKIKLQKKGLMQLLLTGIVRVNTQES